MSLYVVYCRVMALKNSQSIYKYLIGSYSMTYPWGRGPVRAAKGWRHICYGRTKQWVRRRKNGAKHRRLQGNSGFLQTCTASMLMWACWQLSPQRDPRFSGGTSRAFGGNVSFKLAVGVFNTSLEKINLSATRWHLDDSWNVGLCCIRSRQMCFITPQTS